MTLLHSSMCSDTGTEYGMGGRAWLLGLSDKSVHGVTTGVAGSSLTGMGVAKGAGMHCALDMSAEEKENTSRGEGMNVGTDVEVCEGTDMFEVFQFAVPGPISPRDSSPLEDI